MTRYLIIYMILLSSFSLTAMAQTIHSLEYETQDLQIRKVDQFRNMDEGISARNWQPHIDDIKLNPDTDRNKHKHTKTFYISRQGPRGTFPPMKHYIHAANLVNTAKRNNTFDPAPILPMGPPYLVFLTQDIFDVQKDIYIDLTNNDRPIPEEFSTVPVCSLPISDPSD